MTSQLRIASLNLHAYFGGPSDHVRSLAEILAGQECDVVLLQECRRPWLDVVCQATGMTGMHAHQLAPEIAPTDFAPDGCAIAVRAPTQLTNCWRIAPDSFRPEAVQQEIFEHPPPGFQPMPDQLAYRYSGRSILGEIDLEGRAVVVGSFHATPGTGKVGAHQVGEWKPFFHGGVAIEVSRIAGSFIFAIDANEPRRETGDSVTFHWEDGRSGNKKMQALLGFRPIHRARDLGREWLGRTACEPFSDEVLVPTYYTAPDQPRRFDSMWATPDLELVEFETEWEGVVSAHGDHAMLVATLRLW